MEKRSAMQTSRSRASLNRATRFPKRSWETVTILCRFTAHGFFMPSVSSRTTSDGTPRIVEVIGATVMVDRYSTALSRVNTTTGLCLSGGANRYRRTSPRAIFPATPPRLPTPAIRLYAAIVSNSPRDPEPPGLAVPIAGGALEGLRELTPNDSVSCAAPLDRLPATTSYRAQPGWFPCVDSTPQYSPQSRGSIWTNSEVRQLVETTLQIEPGRGHPQQAPTDLSSGIPLLRDDQNANVRPGLLHTIRDATAQSRGRWRLPVPDPAQPPESNGRLVVAGIHSGVERGQYINAVTSQRTDQPVLSRIFVEVELHRSGTKRKSRGTNALFIGLFLSRDVGIYLPLVSVVEG